MEEKDSMCDGERNEETLSGSSSHGSGDDRKRIVDNCGKDEGLGVFHIRAAPVAEVYSVMVKPNDSSLLGDGKPWEIYGVIEITDGEGKPFEIFNEDRDDPQTLQIESGLLSVPLTDPVYKAFPVFKWRLHLMERVRNLELVNDTLQKELKGFHGYEAETEVEHVKGKEGSGVIHFSIFPAAVIAAVDFVVKEVGTSAKEKSEESNDGGSDLDGVIDVYGNIIAYCHCKYRSSYSTTLFSEQKENAVKIKYGDPIELPRCVVAVPAYALSLVIKSRLQDHDLEDAEFPVEDMGTSTKEIALSNDLVIEVTIDWVHAYLEENRTSSKVFSSPQSLMNMQVFRSETPCIPPTATMTEIFSIFVVSNKDKLSKLYGFIEVESRSNKCLIYERKNSFIPKKKQKTSETVPCSKKIGCIVMDGPHKRCFASNHFVLKVDLRDEDGQVFCKGFMAWDSKVIGIPISWLSRRICSIIPSEHGFVAIYYSIFSSAAQARLKFQFSCNECFPCDLLTNVSGLIVAMYSNYDYSTSYDKEHYCSVLFSKSETYPSKLSWGQDIPLQLLKSVVPVPKDHALRIGVNLAATPEIGDQSVQVLQDIAEFHIRSGSHWKISSKDYSVTVTLEWSN